MQNTTLPLYVLLERLGFAAAATAVDTVAHFTRSSFESSSVVFLSPHQVHKLCKQMQLFLFLGRQTSREALAFILITLEVFNFIFSFFLLLFSTLMITVVSQAPGRQGAGVAVVEITDMSQLAACSYMETFTLSINHELWHIGSLPPWVNRRCNSTNLRYRPT